MVMRTVVLGLAFVLASACTETHEPTGSPDATVTDAAAMDAAAMDAAAMDALPGDAGCDVGPRACDLTLGSGCCLSIECDCNPPTSVRLCTDRCFPPGTAPEPFSADMFCAEREVAICGRQLARGEITAAEQTACESAARIMCTGLDWPSGCVRRPIADDLQICLTALADPATLAMPDRDFAECSPPALCAR